MSTPSVPGTVMPSAIKSNHVVVQTRLPASEYEAYLKSPAWAKKKQWLMSKKGFDQCFICKNSRVELHFHHVTYDRLGYEFTNDVMRLCSSCHAAVHSVERGTIQNMAREWRRLADRNCLWRMLDDDPIEYAMQVATFFHVQENPLVVIGCRRTAASWRPDDKRPLLRKQAHDQRMNRIRERKLAKKARKANAAIFAAGRKA